MCRVLFRFSCSSGALEPGARASSAAITGGHCDKFHQVESDIFVAPRSRRRALCFVHENLSVEMGMNSIIAKLVSDQPSGNRLFLQRRAYNDHVGSWAGRPLDASCGTCREESQNSREQCAG